MTSGVKIGKMGLFDFNPRGNLWYNDESTFGHKLLSRMGWSKGKGLGKKEDGIKENIKLAKKDSNTGVGWKNDVHISVGCVEYEEILSKLNQRFNNKETKDPSIDLESLEQRSQNSRNHLHYQKFVRGKDLFKRSEKDLKCIFLENPRDLAFKGNLQVKEEVTFKSELNMKDYFAMKMQNKKESLASQPTSPIKNIEKQLPSEAPTKKRKNTFDNSLQEDGIKKIKLECEELSEDLSDAKVSNSENSTSQHMKMKHKTKKSKKNKLSKIKNLKSCIKRGSYNLNNSRSVSFCEEVAYKILDTSFEDVMPVNDSVVENDNSQTEDAWEEIENGMTEQHKEIEKDGIEHNKEMEGHLEQKEEVSNSDNETLEDEAIDELPECCKLPKCSLSNFNFWLESQRSALNMKMYKRMIKKLRTDKVLRTTNMLDIKGYGNWGL